MASRKIERQLAKNRIVQSLIDRTALVNVSQNKDGRWNVSCYDKRGHYIGGQNSVPHQIALNSARLYMS